MVPVDLDPMLDMGACRHTDRPGVAGIARHTPRFCDAQDEENEWLSKLVKAPLTSSTDQRVFPQG
ncbi:MAG: hypothetical protein ACC654_11650, partial [Acidimicrobiia bacterium]